MTTNRKKYDFSIWKTPYNYRIVIKYNNYFHIWKPKYEFDNKIYSEVIVNEELWEKIKKNWIEKRSSIELYILNRTYTKQNKSIKELISDRFNKIEKNY